MSLINKEVDKTKVQLADELGNLRHQISKLEESDAKRQRIEAELRARVLQQELVAGLGLRALSGIDLDTLFDEAAVLVTHTLKIEYCHILELLPDQDVLLLRAGVGWQTGLVGQAMADAHPNSHLGYTLFSSKPVIVEDINTDTRFKKSQLLQNHAVVSGVNVIIEGENWPFGVMGMYTSTRQTFAQDDIHFLQTVANILATTVAHKRTQKALQDAHDKLETRVKERTARLQAANKELKTFAYTVSHDLRAPLVNVKGFVRELDYALEDVQSVTAALLSHLNKEQQQIITTALQEDIPEAMNFINSSVTRMNDLINAILKLSRLGYRELNFELIDMEALVHHTLKTLAHQIEQRQVNVTVASLPKITADRTSMEQIMGNIIGNAVMYLSPDRRGEIEILGQSNNDAFIIHIRDNGRGIVEDDIPKVFELFRRVGKQDVAGEGVGLAYVRALIHRHSGRIWCESAIDQGTTFTFTIPYRLKQGGNHA